MVLYEYAINRWCRPPEKPAGKRRKNAGRDEDFMADWKEGFIIGWKEGFADGKKKGHQEWRAWLQRKNAAESQGLPFTEPTPGETRYPSVVSFNPIRQGVSSNCDSPTPGVYFRHSGASRNQTSQSATGVM